MADEADWQSSGSWQISSFGPPVRPATPQLHQHVKVEILDERRHTSCTHLAKNSFGKMPIDTQLSEADVILNRTNIALARSQRLIQSWLPARTEAEQGKVAPTEDDERDFVGMTEAGGIGSKRAFEDDDLPMLKRTRLSSNDKLLEQWLGKKAAQAKRKSQEAHKSTTVSRHAAAKQAASEPTAGRLSESDDEGEGRAAAFRSKKRKVMPNHEPVVTDKHAGDDVHFSEAGEQVLAQGLDVQTDDRASKAEDQSTRKAGSYLDEVLSQKAKKKSKKRHRSMAGAASDLAYIQKSA